MSWIAQSLWDLIKPPPPKAERAPSSKDQAIAIKRPSRRGTKRPTGMRARYDALVVEMKRTYGIRVRKWRTSSSGCAWEVHYHNGQTVRLIESPYPRGPMSCAIFLHEVGHHAIGFGRYRPRCLEEYHAWRWAIETMQARDLNVTARVEKRMADSLHYAVQKAMRRGLRRLPGELEPYIPSPRG